MGKAKVEVDVGLNASGFKTGLQHVSAQAEKFSGDLNRKFSAGKIFGSVLTGIGLGSGFALVQTAVEKIAGFWKDAADSAKVLEASSAETLAHIQRMVLIDHPEQELGISRKNLKAAQEEQAAADSKQSGWNFYIGATGPGFERNRTPEDERDSADAKKKVEALEEKIKLLEKQRKDREDKSTTDWRTSLDDEGKKAAEAKGMDWDDFHKMAVPRKKVAEPAKTLEPDKKANDFRENIAADSLASIGGGGNVNATGPVSPVVAELKTQTAVLQKMLVVLGGGGTNQFMLRR